MIAGVVGFLQFGKRRFAGTNWIKSKKTVVCRANACFGANYYCFFHQIKVTKFKWTFLLQGWLHKIILNEKKLKRFSQSKINHRKFKPNILEINIYYTLDIFYIHMRRLYTLKCNFLFIISNWFSQRREKK